MAQVVNATDVTVDINDIVVGCAQSFNFTISRAMDPATCGASGDWTEVSPGRKSGSGSIAAQLRKFDTGEAATNVSYEDVYDLLNEGTGVTITYGTTVAGDTRFSGLFYVSNLSWDAPEEGVVTWSADLTLSGPITKVVVPA
jgi:hypothetical protein